MPYTHYHDGSRHTHHRRRVGDRHYRYAESQNRRERRRNDKRGKLILTLFAIGAIAGVVSFVVFLLPELQLTEEEKAALELKKEEERAARELKQEAEIAMKRDAFEREVGQLTNAERSNLNIHTLEWDEKLQEIARTHSKDMAENGFFSHDNLIGDGPSERGDKVGYYCRKPGREGLGENIYFIDGGNYSKADRSVQGWMESSGHRRLMLERKFDKIGIGAWQGNYPGSGSGTYVTMVLC